MLTRPDIYTDPLLSAGVRDAVFAACLDLPALEAADSEVAPVAIRLAAQLRAARSCDLGEEERNLLLKWLGHLGGQVTTGVVAGRARSAPLRRAVSAPPRRMRSR